jgi:hypothetical protein
MFEKKEESAYLMYDRKKFLIDNINILEKIPVYNQNIKYRKTINFSLSRIRFNFEIINKQIYHSFFYYCIQISMNRIIILFFLKPFIFLTQKKKLF